MRWARGSVYSIALFSIFSRRGAKLSTIYPGQEIKTFRMKPDIARRVERAAAQAGMSQSIYLEQTLEARFRREWVA
jgi:hypothetical protein